MVPFFELFPLVCLSVAARCRAAEARQLQVARTEDWYKRENGGGVGMRGGLARIPEEFEHFQTAPRPPSGGVGNGVQRTTKYKRGYRESQQSQIPCTTHHTLASEFAALILAGRRLRNPAATVGQLLARRLRFGYRQDDLPRRPRVWLVAPILPA